jgi:CheY-like chemotaxis protein
MPESIDPTKPRPGTGVCILYAEDEENDVFFLKRALRISGSPCTLNAVPDGQRVIEYLTGVGEFADRVRHPLPALILLDINMPRIGGLEVLRWIRQQPIFKSLPVLMFTSSTRNEDRDSARQLGADDYLLKPSDPLTLTEFVRTLHDRWLTSLITSPKSRKLASSAPAKSLTHRHAPRAAR